jgi:hypothetical protein
MQGARRGVPFASVKSHRQLSTVVLRLKLERVKTRSVNMQGARRSAALASVKSHRQLLSIVLSLDSGRVKSRSG